MPEDRNTIPICSAADSQKLSDLPQTITTSNNFAYPDASVDTIVTEPSRNNRIFFIDYLRAALITLVVLHHIAVVYTGIYPFYYMEPTTDILSIGLLFLFLVLNQTWFMGLFYLLSGYFSPSSFDRKGPGKFVKDRLIRLGIPLLIFSFVIGPLASYIGFPHNTVFINAGYTLHATWKDYLSVVSPGPLWFLVLLIAFDLCYALYRVSAVKWKALRWDTKGLAFPTYRTIASFIILLAFASWLFWIVVPVGMIVVFFPTLGYLPQYLGFFIVGLIASRNDWFNQIPGSVAKRVGIATVLATFILLPLEAIGGGGAVFASVGGIGGINWPSAVFALWNSTLAVGIYMVLIVLFRHYFNRDGRHRNFLYTHSYTVFITHVLVIVVITAIVLQSLVLYPLLKFAIAAAITVPLCWGFAYTIRKIPLAEKVL